MQTVKSNLTSRSYRYDLPVFSLSRLLCCSQLIGWKHQTVHASFNALLTTESLCSDSNWGLNRLNRQCQLKMRKNKSLIDKNTNKVWRCLKQGHPFFILIHLGSLHWKGNTVSADSCHPMPPSMALPLHKLVDKTVRKQHTAWCQGLLHLKLPLTACHTFSSSNISKIPEWSPHILPFAY